MTPAILFCEDPLQKNKVDTDFAAEHIAAKENGFETLMFSYDDLVSDDSMHLATRRIGKANALTNVVYRGWMLTLAQYAALHNDLLSKNYRLINSPAEYRNCHYLPDSLQFIDQRTPRTVFEKLDNDKSIERLIDKATVFGSKPVMIKDYVKSEKHNWEDACFVADASDTKRLRQSINNLVWLRDKYLNEGIVIREFMELKNLAIHSKSGMPLAEEYRLFFCNKKFVGLYEYWEEGEYKTDKPGTQEFEEIAAGVASNFFSMDIARTREGEFIIIELGDGQVSGLPDALNGNEFYAALKKCL